GTEIPVDGQSECVAAGRTLEAPRNVEIGEVEHTALGRGEPEQWQTGRGPREDAVAVGEAERVGVEIAAGGEEAVAGRRARIGEAANRHRRLRRWRAPRIHRGPSAAGSHPTGAARSSRRGWRRTTASARGRRSTGR